MQGMVLTGDRGGAERLSGLSALAAREILRALCSALAVQHAGGLANLDEISVWVSHVAADLRSSVDWRRHEPCALRRPVFVAGLNVGDSQVNEYRGRVAGLVVDHRDIWLVRRGWSARIHDDPRIRQLDDAWVLVHDDSAAQHARVEVPGYRHLADGDKDRHQNALVGRRE